MSPGNRGYVTGEPSAKAFFYSFGLLQVKKRNLTPAGFEADRGDKKYLDHHKGSNVRQVTQKPWL